MSVPTPDPARGAEVYALDRAHVFHSWSAQAQIKPMTIVASEGSYVWDYDGNRYLDLNSGQFCAVLGHSDPGVSRKMLEISQTLQDTDTSTLTRPVLLAAKKIHGLGKIAFLFPDASTYPSIIRRESVGTFATASCSLK